ncbi:hypothetical protein LCGC14_1664990 [marine sediment metagenome]|uniref:Uncharacterized protein n=1 Tax=marine sediment metagenome TaxID=412755 RepID=A0A0F9KSY1_9ZZZZ
MTEITKYSTSWFKKKFGDGDENEFLIQHIPDSLHDEIRKKCIVKTPEKNGEEIEYTEEVDNEKYNVALFDEALKDWKGFVKKGKEVKCTLEAKKLVLTNLPDRAFFIVKTARDPLAFYEEFDAIKKKFEELLNTSLNGIPTPPASTVANV